MIAGKFYNPMDEELSILCHLAWKLTHKFNTTKPNTIKKRTKILKKLFGRTGENLYMEKNLRVDYGNNIHVGENFYANFDCMILDVSPVVSGNNVVVVASGQVVTKSFGDNVVIGGNPARILKQL